MRRLSMLAGAGAAFAALLAPAHAAAAQLGINEHPEQPIVNYVGTYSSANYTRVLSSMQAAGARIVRIPVPWVWLEPNAKGQYDQTYVSKVDAFMAAARQRGMKVLVTTGGPPCWATSYPGATCGSGYLSTNGAIYPPRNMADAADDASYIAGRWSRYLAGVEVLNEPNSTQFFQVPAGDNTALDYTSIVKAEYGGVKRVAPTIAVLAGALAFSDTGFLQSMYSDGVAAYSDVISIHPYNIRFDDPFVYWGDPALPWQDAPQQSFATGVPSIHNVMVANGDASKPLWLTEFGFSDCNPAYLCMDQSTQAQYLKESLDLVKTWSYVKYALVHEAWDASANRETWNGFGLLRNDYSRRPAYCTFASAAGISGCTPDALSSELGAQQDLTRAWQLARTYYIAHGRSFTGFDAAALHTADASLSGYPLTATSVSPSSAANPSSIGIYLNGTGTDIEVCNASTTMAYCIYEHTGDATPWIAHGKDPGSTWSAAGATNNGSSTTW